MNTHAESYIEEANELLAELETALLELEKTPEDAELIGQVFRAMHTIKGSGAMFGFDDIASFTHELETVYDMVRDGKVAVTRELIDLSLSASDQIKAMLDGATGGPPHDGTRSEKIVNSLAAFTAQETAASSVAKTEPVPQPAKATGSRSTETTYRIRFQANEDLFRTGTDPLLLLNDLAGLGICSIVAHTRDIPVLEVMDPETCYTFWDVILTTDRGLDAVKDVFIFVEDLCEIHMEEIHRAGEEEGEIDYKRVGEILLERGEVTAEELANALAGQKPIGEILVDSKIVDQCPVQSALVEQEHVKRVRQKKQESASIRVTTEKLDTLVDLVGELVTVQARLSRKAAMEQDPELTTVAETVERLTAELRDNTMNIRMLSIGTTFNKFNRLIRDLSDALGKDVVMTTEGGETELDKTMIERLNDPLVHLLRNSIDHGIEPPEARLAAGKPKQGTVHLSAEHSGAGVLIRISDDGAGLDAETLRAGAVTRGVIEADATIAEEEIFSLIFEPGFSTAERVTDVSGRGVGMDVVKRSIESLRGSIGIKSTRGTGTTITLKLPLTLAIIDGLLVETDGTRYVLPLSTIEECVELTADDQRRTHGRNILNIRGEIVPYIPLRERFAIAGNPPDIQRVIINGINGKRIGVVVDRVIGEQQVVIKTMSRLYRDVAEVSGATIMGDGTVALILDMLKLMEGTGDEGRMAREVR